MSARSDWIKVQVIRALSLAPIRALTRSRFSGNGVIFTLHRVVERAEETLVPGIAITADFLVELVEVIRRHGHELVPLSEVPPRLRGEKGARKWACLTFDDGFRDNLTIASPILTRLGVPYTLFLVSDWVLGAAVNHAALIEAALLERDRLTLEYQGQSFTFGASSHNEKLASYPKIDVMRWRDRAFDAALPSLLAAQGIDADAVMRSTYLLRDDALRIANDGCCEIGSHTMRHPPLAHLADGAARNELQGSRDALAALFGRAPELVAYPFGSSDQCGPREYAMAAECGYRVGVTTRLGNVFPDALATPLALPRTGLSLHRHGHSPEFVRAVLDGSRNALMNRGKRHVA